MNGQLIPAWEAGAREVYAPACHQVAMTSGFVGVVIVHLVGFIARLLAWFGQSGDGRRSYDSPMRDGSFDRRSHLDSDASASCHCSHPLPFSKAQELYLGAPTHPDGTGGRLVEPLPQALSSSRYRPIAGRHP